MSGNFITCPTSYVLRKDWVGGAGSGYKVGFSDRFSKLSKKNTYVLIFGPGSADLEEFLCNSDKVKILHKGKKSVNSTPGHGSNPRNTLVIFEMV